MHKVKCKCCNQIFDRDKESFIKIDGGRYIHEECFQKYNKELDDLKNLKEYIMKILKIDHINSKIEYQIKEYKEKYNYTYSGMCKTLYYWYEIKKNSIEKANGGIGIVPSIYNIACQYYYNLYLIKEANKNKELENYKIKVKSMEIYPPQKRNYEKIKLFDLEE